MYEWMDGILMQAMQNGEWVLLSNVNLCSPTVLDRLNSLVETNGFIVLNERGLVDGSAQTVRPHPDFRVFMTLDPHHGELSRAMRNRGVEIAFIQPAASSQDADVLVRAALGGAFSAIGAVMTMAHLSLVDAAEQYKFKPPALRQLLRWASLVRAHLLKGRCSQMLKDCLRHSLGVCS
jgi:midasin